jgi:hypothetical protein
MESDVEKVGHNLIILRMQHTLTFEVGFFLKWHCVLFIK